MPLRRRGGARGFGLTCSWQDGVLLRRGDVVATFARRFLVIAIVVAVRVPSVRSGPATWRLGPAGNEYPGDATGSASRAPRPATLRQSERTDSTWHVYSPPTAPRFDIAR